MPESSTPPVSATPVTLLRGAATVLPRSLVARLAAQVVACLQRSRPRLLANLAGLEPAVVHVSPVDLPYRFELRVGVAHVTLGLIERDGGAADAEIVASVATLVELLEGRIDSDTLFFRRDLEISGNTSVVVGLRNVLDREELCLAAELAAPLGRLGTPARALARRLDGLLDRVGARLAAMHRTLHPLSESTQDLTAELGRCRTEIAAMEARVARVEARQGRREAREA